MSIHGRFDLLDKNVAYFFCGHVHAELEIKKLYNTYVFNAACDETMTRGWVVELENGKYEKVDYREKFRGIYIKYEKSVD